MTSITSPRGSTVERDNAPGFLAVRAAYLRSVRVPLLLAIVLSVVVPTVLVTIISSVVNINNATNRAYEQMETVSILRASQIGFWVNLLEDELNTIATDPDHLLLVRQAEPNSAFPTLREPAQEDLFLLYRQLLDQFVQFASLNLITPDGSSIVGTDQTAFSFELTDTPQQGEVYVVGPLLDEETAELTMFAWYPVFDGERFLAYLGGTVDMTTLYNILQDETGTGERIETFLVDEQGHVIISGEPVFVHSDFEYVLGETTMTLPVNIASSTTNVTRLEDFASYSGEATFALADTSLPLDTFLITEQTQGNVLNAAYTSVLYSAVVTFAAVLIVILLGVTFIERRIVHPIQTLSETANKVASGDLAQRTSMNRADEIGVLAASFNTMTNQLATSIDTLEERVQERTADLVAARDEAQQANDAKSAFLASTSHELRTPLNAILNFTALVARGKYGSVTEQQTEILNRVTKNGRYLLNLINDLLDMSKIASGSLEIYKSDVDLNAEIDEVIKIAQGLNESESVELITEVDPELPTLFGDSIRVRQIMINLISNAFKFTEEGYVKLVASHQDGTFCFMVEDTGVGIEAKDYDAVFGAFQQTESGLRKGKGTGLGMAISKSLAEAHHGTLWFESTLGEGTTFYLELPLQTESPAMVEPTT